MKKKSKSHFIYGSTIIVLATALIVLTLKSTSEQLEKFTFVTELYPMKVIETNGETRILWVQARNDNSKTISFYADNRTVDTILAK